MAWLIVAVTMALVVVAIAVWLSRTFVAVTVEGTSMTPTLVPGDRVLVRRGRRGLRRAAIVVIARPDPERGWRGVGAVGRDLSRPWSIKRAVSIAGDPFPPVVHGGGRVPDGHIVVLGDHVVSADSKLFGPCPVDQILGVVVRRLGATRPASPDR